MNINIQYTRRDENITRLKSYLSKITLNYVGKIES